MIHIFRKIFTSGTVTKSHAELSPAKKYRGKLAVDSTKCTQHEQCVDLCPVDAIQFKEKNNEGQLTIDYTKCFYCGICVDSCPNDALTQTNLAQKSTRDRNNLFVMYVLNNNEKGDTRGKYRKTIEE